MADQRPEPVGERGPPAGAPVWLKVFGVVVLMAVVVLVIVMLASGGHSPGIHRPP